MGPSDRPLKPDPNFLHLTNLARYQISFAFFFLHIVTSPITRYWVSELGTGTGAPLPHRSSSQAPLLITL